MKGVMNKTGDHPPKIDRSNLGHRPKKGEGGAQRVWENVLKVLLESNFFNRQRLIL